MFHFYGLLEVRYQRRRDPEISLKDVMEAQPTAQLTVFPSSLAEEAALELCDFLLGGRRELEAQRCRLLQLARGYPGGPTGRLTSGSKLGKIN
jgi:hypothetical protein